MKKIFAWVLVFLFFAANVWATTYTVSQSGAGADYSLSGFNALSGDYSGDAFYFSGTITGEITPQIYGTSGNPVILDGYQTDNTTFQNLSESAGRALIDRTTSDNYGINISGVDYITIRDFEVTDVNQGIRVDDSTGVLIQRTYVYECDNGVIFIDAINFTFGGSLGSGNVVKNVGNATNHEDVAVTGSATVSHDGIISYNHLYADNTSWGIDGILNNSNTYDILVEYNSIHSHNHATAQGENGIDLKNTPYNWVIRFNHIYDHQYAFEVIFNGNSSNSADQVYIYGNSIHDGGEAAIGFQYEDSQSYDNIYIMSNLIYNYPERGISNASWGHGTVDPSDGLFILNNTLAENGNSANDEFDTHLYSNAGWMTVKNNIFIKGSSPTYSYRQVNLTQYADDYTDSEHNRYYYPSQTINIDWGDAGVLTLAGIQGGSTDGLPQENDSPSGSEGDPGLVDWDNGDFRVDDSAAVIDGGADLGTGNIVSLTINGETVDVPWDFGFGSNTDFSGTLPTIDAKSRDTEGWDQGAFVYGESGGSNVIIITKW